METAGLSRAELEVTLREIFEKSFKVYEELMTKEVTSHALLKLQVNLTFDIARCCHHIPEHLLLKIIPLLADCLSESDDDYDFDSPSRALEEAALHCLTRIACIAGGKFVPDIANSGVMGYVGRLLYYAQLEVLQLNKTDDFLRVVLKLIWVLVSFGDECRVILYERGGVGAVTYLLKVMKYHESIFRDNTSHFLLEILTALAMVPSARTQILDGGGLRFLVDAFGIGSMASRERACQAIGLIGVSSKQLRQMIAEMGAIPLLINLYIAGEFNTKLVAANVLGLTLTHLSYIRPAAQAGAIPLYAQLLEHSGISGMPIAVDAFFLLCVAEENAVSVASHIARILRDGDAEAKEYACHVLWIIAAYKHSIPVVQISGALPFLFQLLEDTKFLRKNVCSVIAKLSDNKVDRQGLVDEGMIPLLLDILEDETDGPVDSYSSGRLYAAKAIMNFYEDPDCRDKVDEEVDESYLQELKSLINNWDHLLDSEFYFFEYESGDVCEYEDI